MYLFVCLPLDKPRPERCSPNDACAEVRDLRYFDPGNLRGIEHAAIRISQDWLGSHKHVAQRESSSVLVIRTVDDPILAATIQALLAIMAQEELLRLIRSLPYVIERH